MTQRVIRLAWFLFSLCTPWRVEAAGLDPIPLLRLLLQSRLESPSPPSGAPAPAPETPLPARAPGELAPHGALRLRIDPAP